MGGLGPDSGLVYIEMEPAYSLRPKPFAQSQALRSDKARQTKHNPSSIKYNCFLSVYS